MNIAERYVCSYIVECLTGKPGENQERVHEYLKATTMRPQDSLLRFVLEAAREKPDDKATQDLVAALVVTSAADNNPFLHDYLFQYVDWERSRDMQKEKEQKPVKKAPTVYFVYSAGEQEGTVTITIWFGIDPMAMVVIPDTVFDTALERFKEKFPDGIVLNADE